MTTNILMPPGFPNKEWTIINNRLWKKYTSATHYERIKENGWVDSHGHIVFKNCILFFNAWEGIKLRYKACDSYNKSFTSSINKHTSNPRPYIRYLQDKSLFGFFSNGKSILDCICFSIYTIAFIQDLCALNPKFKDSEWHKVKPRFVLERFKDKDSPFKQENITLVLEIYFKKTNEENPNKTEYEKFKEFRNHLNHRAGPTRITYEGKHKNGHEKQIETYWNYSPQLKIDNNTSESFYKWIKNITSNLINEINIFTKKYLTII